MQWTFPNNFEPQYSQWPATNNLYDFPQEIAIQPSNVNNFNSLSDGSLSSISMTASPNNFSFSPVTRQARHEMPPVVHEPFPPQVTCPICDAKYTVITAALIEYLYRTSGMQRMFPRLLFDRMVHFIHLAVQNEDTQTRIPKEVFENHLDKALYELRFVMFDTYHWVESEPQNFAVAVTKLQDLAQLGMIERHLPQYDIMRFAALHKAVALVRGKPTTAKCNKKISQRYHKIFLPSACCIVRALANSISVRDPWLYSYVLRTELCQLFGMVVTTKFGAKNQAFVIRKRTFELPLFRQVVGPVVGMDLSVVKSRDAVSSLLRARNQTELPQIDAYITQMSEFLNATVHAQPDAVMMEEGRSPVECAAPPFKNESWNTIVIDDDDDIDMDDRTVFPSWQPFAF